MKLHACLLLLVSLCCLQPAKGQDTVNNLGLAQADTIIINWKDSTSKKPATTIADSAFNNTIEDLNILHYNRNVYFGFSSDPTRIISSRKSWQGKELWFYSLVGFLFVFGFFRQGFEKYLTDLFRLFFNTTMKQRQLREQMLQTPVASALLNLFFVMAAGFYISFLLQYFKLIAGREFWIMWLYASIFLVLVYLVKYIWLKIAGWMFNLRNAADDYIFIVFIINKVIGIFLIPVIILLAFGRDTITGIVISFSWVTLAGILLYRFILTFAIVRNQINASLFHFFLYLCAFEIVPLLLIYKALLSYFTRS